MPPRVASTRRKCIAAVAAFLLFAETPLSSWAGFTDSDIGTSGAQFLKLGAGARAEGMGEAYTAVVDGADAMYWNPASLTRIDSRSFTFMHSALPAGINYEFLAYGQSLGSYGGAGASLQYLSQPGLDETDSNGFNTGTTYHPNDFAAALGYGYTLHDEDLGVLLDGSSLGMNVKFIQSTLTHTVSTLATDLGYLTAPHQFLGSPIRFSYVVQNLGGTLRFEQAADPLPLNLRLGTSWLPSSNWTVAMDINEPLDNHPYLSIGTEYRYPIGPDSNFSARVGLDSRAFGDAGDFSGITMGFGAKLHYFGLDYAFAPQGVLGITQYVSINFYF